MRLVKVFNLGLGFIMALVISLSMAKEINFGVISTDSATAQKERWEPFFRDMEKQTGLTVKAFYATDYAGVIEAMRFNKVQVAWYGNKAAMEAFMDAMIAGGKREPDPVCAASTKAYW